MPVKVTVYTLVWRLTSVAVTDSNGAVSVPVPSTPNVTVYGAFDVTEYYNPVQLTRFHVPMEIDAVPEPMV